MTADRKRVAAIVAGVAAFVVLFGAGWWLAGSDILPLRAEEKESQLRGAATTAPMGCNDWAGTYTQKECFAAGVIRTALQNIQPAVQFCKWKAANPGEWSRLRQQAAIANVTGASVVTWMGAAVRDQLIAYGAIGAPGFELQAQLPPNACGGKVIGGPVVQGVTPGQTDVTVTVTTTP